MSNVSHNEQQGEEILLCFIYFVPFGLQFMLLQPLGCNNISTENTFIYLMFRSNIHHFVQSIPYKSHIVNKTKHKINLKTQLELR